MTELVAADIGGTHARFAIAEVTGGQVVRLGEPVTLATSAFEGLSAAWDGFARAAGRPLPRAAALAVASPVGGGEIRLTNNDWVIRPASLDAELGLDQHLLLNDFGAVAHAVQHAPADQFIPICGPDQPLPDDGVITVCGPGTGLGVAQLLRGPGGYRVIETEGGHVGFAPVDLFGDELVTSWRDAWGRVSAERVCSGHGLALLFAHIVALQGGTPVEANDRAVWDMALDGSDAQAAAALEHFCRALGGVAGDLALAQGACAVVIAGGLGLRLKDRLAASGFAKHFRNKGRFTDRMATLPVRLISHPQPGLFGAASAFAAQ